MIITSKFGYSWDTGPFDFFNLPEAPCARYPRTIKQCAHCNRPIIQLHAGWYHAAKEYKTDEPDRWWWGGVSSRNEVNENDFNCIGATPK